MALGASTILHLNTAPLNAQTLEEVIVTALAYSYDYKRRFDVQLIMKF